MLRATTAVNWVALTRVTVDGVICTPVFDINLTVAPTLNLSPVIVNVSLPLAVLSTSVGETEETTRNDFGSSCFFYLESTSTTSEVTYKTQMANYVNGTGGARVNGSANDQSSMVLMEILA